MKHFTVLFFILIGLILLNCNKDNPVTPAKNYDTTITIISPNDSAMVFSNVTWLTFYWNKPVADSIISPYYVYLSMYNNVYGLYETWTENAQSSICPGNRWTWYVIDTVMDKNEIKILKSKTYYFWVDSTNPYRCN